VSARPHQAMIASLADARARRNRPVELAEAVRSADGPDEREAALARLTAYLDEVGLQMGMALCWVCVGLTLAQGLWLNAASSAVGAVAFGAASAEVRRERP
jgi:hypothetical protein